MEYEKIQNLDFSRKYFFAGKKVQNLITVPLLYLFWLPLQFFKDEKFSLKQIAKSYESKYSAPVDLSLLDKKSLLLTNIYTLISIPPYCTTIITQFGIFLHRKKNIFWQCPTFFVLFSFPILANRLKKNLQSKPKNLK